MFSSRKSTCHLATVRSVFLLLMGLGLSLSVYAQVVGGTIEGTVTDPKGAVLPDVKVEIVNVATQITTTLSTNADGFYTAPNLLPGNYSVTATRSGFATAETDLILTVGAQRVANLSMRIGRINEVVKVQTEVPEVEL